MGWQDRPYNRPDYNDGPQGGMRMQLPRASVVMWLLGINCVVFMLDAVLGGSQRASAIAPYMWANFNIEQAVFKFQLWRWVSYQFIHADFFHLLFNMIALYFFGRLMENWWGSRRFLVFYLLCGISGAIVASVLGQIPGLVMFGPNTMLVGASGSIFGILVACAVLYPHQRVMLIFPPIPMTMRTIALVFLGFAVLSVLVGSANAGGEAAHLGGAVLGFFLVKKPGLLNFADRSYGGSGRSMTSRFKQANIARKKRMEADLQKEVDRILDKVHQKGIQSLTKKEQKTLREATESQRRTG